MPKPAAYTPEQKKLAIELIESGASNKEVNEQTGIKLPAIAYLKRKEGLSTPRPRKNNTEETVTTSKELENLVIKSFHRYLTDHRRSGKAVEVDIVFRVGKAKYTPDDLIKIEHENIDKIEQELHELDKKREELLARLK